MTATPGDRFSVRDRVVIVTGGGRGIGRALSEGFAAGGAKVVVTSRSEAACRDTVDAIEQAGGTALAVAADVGDAAARTELLAATIDTFGTLDVLVNNAGILKPHLTERLSEDEVDEIFRVNVKGPVFLSQCALPHLTKAGGGSIVNIGALGAYQPMAGIGAYCAAKAAMVNWTSTMAKEWAERRVRVNLVVPGPVATDMILPRDPDQRAAFTAQLAAETLVGRIADPEDLVGAVLFLASDASAFMTGRSLFLDGGMLA